MLTSVLVPNEAIFGNSRLLLLDSGLTTSPALWRSSAWRYSGSGVPLFSRKSGQEAANPRLWVLSFACTLLTAPAPFVLLQGRSPLQSTQLMSAPICFVIFPRPQADRKLAGSVCVCSGRVWVRDGARRARRLPKWTSRGRETLRKRNCSEVFFFLVANQNKY